MPRDMTHRNFREWAGIHLGLRDDSEVNLECLHRDKDTRDDGCE